MTPLTHCMARALAALTLLVSDLPTLAAQDGGPGTGGAVRLEHERRFLDNPHRVLLIGAHPDDEDNTLITILTRGQGVITGYLSLTRGEGGQNLIGSELGATLGVLRTEELMAARQIDGAQQFFTRAFDFGFSKSAEETFRFWSRDSVLKDVIRIVRSFRPHVIVSLFSGTPRDGHGHHQVAGIVAREAFDVAGDSTRFPELQSEEGLPPWVPQKFYRDYGATDGIELEGGVLDPIVGHSLYQIAMRSRSQHRSQDMGQLEPPGPRVTRIALEARAHGMGDGPDHGLFDGVVAEPPRQPGRRALIRAIEQRLVFDAYVADHEVTPGQRVPLTLVAWNAGTDTVGVEFQWHPTEEWEAAEAVSCTRDRVRLAPGDLTECVVPLVVSLGVPPRQPYYLIEPMDGSLYRWGARVEDRGQPFEAPLRAGFRTMGSDSAWAGRTLEVTARSLDQGLGEVRRPVTVVPRIMLDLSPGRLLWPSGTRSRTFTVTAEHAAPDSTTATIRLIVPADWRVDSARTLHFTREGERRTLTFEVTAPANVSDGEVSFLAEALVTGDSLRLGVRRVAYPHIRERPVFFLADAAAVVAPVRFATGRRIGYLRGAADAIPEALASAGVPFRLLQDDDLDGPLLDSLEVVVIGPRAYETNEALRSAHPRLLRFAERGGTLIVQYQQYQFISGGFPPLPMSIARPHDRITDETAAVRWLVPGAVLATTPNRLTGNDFDDWIQERGLYFARTWDAAWTPLLEMDEPGESPKQGGLLVGRLGRGTVVYTGIAFFRQIPAAVPGAWRLFANLLAFGQR